MAVVRIPDENREITDHAEISEFLEPFGIWYEKWDVDGRITEDASNDDVLQEYDAEIQRLKDRGGFQTADIISVGPETPGLDELLAKFAKEHTHSEDEIRFTIKGNGVFHINPENGPVFGVQVGSGDLINVPAGTRHWFDLCTDKNIRCIRLFLDQSGWAPHYVDDPVHENYMPVCMGPEFLPPGDEIDPVVKI